MRGLICAVVIGMLPQTSCAQPPEEADNEPLSAANFAGFEFRSIGPAFMSGRIADIEILEDEPSTWIVGVGSGGV